MRSLLMYELANDELKVSIAKKGAELSSIIDKKTGCEYVWTANPQYWNRHAPILFPLVGSVWNGEYHVDGALYKLGQHGFARDREFDFIGIEGNKASFKLSSNDETKALFPFDFVLKVVYELNGKVLRVHWIVENPSDKTLYFQVGGHPGFNYPDFKPEDEIHGYFKMNTNHLNYKLIGSKGCLDVDHSYTFDAGNDGYYPINPHLFDKDALVIENSQVTSITLCDKEKKPYITMKYDAPVTGIWSPTNKNAPFVCIEPWYGRCDRVEFKGDYSQKDWINKLDAHKVFETSYTIEVEY